MTRKKMLFVFSAVFVIGTVLGITVISGINPFAGSPGVYLDYLDEKDRVKNSERIVVAKYLGETSHVVDMKNAYDDAVLGEITLNVQKFKNIESLKGDAAIGNMTYVVIKAADSYNLPGGGNELFNRETVSLSTGNDCVVFIRQIPARPEYRGQYGDVVWTYVGEPSIAQIQPSTGNLEFKVTRRFKKDWDVLPSSNAPFELSKQEILTLASSETGTQ